ncbi:MAG: argininosuccinate lyase [Gaiellales bacterium]|nr:argininosuccinate lyase [Gaiellales bacterium]
MRAELDPAILAFSRSLPVDRALLGYDVLASQAHVRMLERVGLLEAAEADALVDALAAVPAVPTDAPDEDVHSYLERCLTEKLGALGRKVHAGRSRNDQVAVATRLWAKDAARELALGVAAAQEALVACARANESVVLPGYTHLQRAQPVLLGHHLAAHAWMLERDAERLRSAYSSADECPLGAGALAGSSLPLDPQWTAAQLGFARSFDNTIDAVADRDFICDLLYACALGFVHLSRLAEEVILFTSQEFAFAQLDDTIALGSSIMPQKKNPQVAEHLRGRAGVAIGRLAAMLAVCKALPLAYDSDLQEDKELAFAQVAAFAGALGATALLVGGLHFDAERMREAAADGATVATDVAEALVRGGMPFREAHEQVASRIAAGERFAEPTPEQAVAARNAPGGTSPERVADQLAALTWRVAATRAWATG